VLELGGVSKSYGDNHVLANGSLTVRRGERGGIIGPNGLGKSTLLKIAVGRLDADAGRVRWGHEARPGYFPQDHRELLTDGEATPLSILEDACPGESPTFVRAQLGRVLFSGEEAGKQVRLLSGGECARLIFALLSVAKPNVLVLDEPTNHLDLEAIHAVVEALKQYPGTLIFVSHDRWFVSELATRIIELTPAGPNDFPGTYAEYLARCGDDHLDGDAVVLKAKRARAEAASSTESSTVSWEEQKRRRNRLAQLPKLRDKVMAAIEAAEARKQAIHDRYADPTFYAQTSHDEIDALGEEMAALEPKLDALMAEWEGIEREIAEADAKSETQ
jgi:ABC-type multidrug transport system ATPase subunit